MNQSHSIKLKYIYILNLFIFGIFLLIGIQFGFSYGLAITIISIISIIVFIYILNKPALALVLTGVAAIIGPWGSIFPNTTLPFTIFQVFLIFSIYLYTLNILFSGNMQINLSKSINISLLFIIILSISVVYSLDKSRALFKIGTLVALVSMTYLISELLIKEVYYKIFFSLTLLISIVLSIYTIYQFTQNPELIILNANSLQSSRVFGRQVASWNDPNDFGIILVLPLLYLIGKIFIIDGLHKIKSNFLYLLILIIIFIALLSTYSRSSWVALTVGVITLFILAKKIKLLFYLIVCLSIMLIILSFNEMFYQSIINRILSITNLSYNTSNIARIVIAIAGIEMFFDSYMLGYGYMSFSKLAPLYYDVNRTLSVVESHNITVTLLAELGILGLVIFSMIFYTFWHAGFILLKHQLSKDSRLYLFSFLSYLIALLMFYQFYPGCLHNNLLWFCFGAILSIRKLNLNNNLLFLK